VELRRTGGLPAGRLQSNVSAGTARGRAVSLPSGPFEFV